ncbi:MAG: MlaD family protein [Sulfuricella sp.]|nr:MlaD family protein [Sulfuricella sp.]
MTLLADKDERFKNLFGKVALFVLLAVLGIALSFMWTGIKKGLLTPKSSVYFVADSGQDIKKGMPVKLRGFKIGTVSDVSMDKEGQVRVEMRIEDKYMPLLREDAVANLEKEGLIGDSILDIDSGTPGKKPLKADGKLQFERGSGMEQIAEEVRDRLLPALDEMHKLLRDVNDPQGDVRQTVKNLREFSAAMRGTGARIDRLLDHVDQTTTNELQPLLRSVRRSAANTETMTEQMNRDLPGMMQKADASLENLRQTSETFKSAIRQSAPQLPGLLGESRELVGGTRDIVDAATASWPLKTIMPQPEQGLVRMDSHD